jgi:hypothetical protein
MAFFFTQYLYIVNTYLTMSDYSYTPVSDLQGEYQFTNDTLSQMTEEQIKKNFCFIVAPETGEVIFFKNREMWAQARQLLEGYNYQLFYCFDVLRNSRLKNTK